MPRVSRRPLKKIIIEESDNHFVTLVSSLQNPQEIKQFFQDFLTLEEKTMLAKRLMLHLMLENNYKTVQIESVLGISKETIRVHKNIWSRGGKMYKIILGKLAKREKAKLLWKKIEKILAPINLFMRAKTDMKARAKFASGEWFDN